MGSFSNLTTSNIFYSWQTTTTGDSFTTAEVSNFSVGSGNFTMECFFYPTSTPVSEGTIFSLGNQNLTGEEFRVSQRIGTNGLGFLYPNTGDQSVSLLATSTLTLNTWCHLALVRSTPTNLFLYSNGIVVLSTNSVNYTSPTNKRLRVFANPYSGNNRGQGYINSMRVVIGQALYTDNFVPPIQQLSTNTVGTYGIRVAASITGTVAFLGGTVSTLTDAGPSALALTVAGSPRSGTAVPTTFTGRIGINCNSPQFALDVNGATNINGNLFMGKGANGPILPNGYTAIGLTGGNSTGYMYGAYEALGDGMHLSYNFVSSNVGTPSYTTPDLRGYIPNTGGGTSQLQLQYSQIQFKTGAINTAPSTLMTLTTSGLGINCNTPSFRLDVNGDSQMSGALAFNTPGNTNFTIVNSRTTAGITQASTLQIFGYNNASGFTRAMVAISPTGLVGINCNTPAYQLDVNGRGNFTGDFDALNVTGTINSNPACIRFLKPSYTAYLGWAGNGILGSASCNIFTINTGTAGTNIALMPYSCNVGINCNSPAYTLDVKGAGNFTDQVHLRGASTETFFGTAATIYNYNTAGTVAGEYRWYTGRTTGGGIVASTLQLYTYFGATIANPLHITPTGFVGIGTAPTVALDVFGSIRAQGTNSYTIASGYQML